MAGEPETEVLEDARKRAEALGAHALIVVETSSTYQPPAVIYEPWPPQFPWYYDRWYGYRYWFYPVYPYPYGIERTLPGGNVYVVRSIAIRFEEREPGDGARHARGAQQTLRRESHGTHAALLP